MPTLSTQPNRAYPNIPEITEDPVTHTIALQAIKGALQTHERRDNNFLKSFIRFEELVDLGIIDETGELVLTTPGTDSGGDDVDPVVPPVTVPTLDELLDVTAPTPIDNDILGFDFSSGLWISQTAAELNLSEIGHTHTVSISLDDLTDVDLSGANDFDLLFRVGNIWTPTNQQLQWDGSDLYIATGDLRFSPIGDTVNSAIRPNLPTPGDLTIQALAGDLFLHPVLDVVLDGSTNLVIESDQAIRWFDQLGAKQTMLEFVPEVAGTGAAVGHVIAKLEAGVTTTSGTYVDVTGAVVPFASLEANEDYAIFVRAYIGNSTSASTAQNKVRLTKGGTLVVGSEEVYESPSTTIDDVGMLYCWGGIVNSGASGDLQLEHLSGNGSDTVFANNITIMMIKVDDLTLGTNIFHDTDTGLVELDDGDFPSAWQATNAGVTVGDTGDYLVFGSVRIQDFLSGGNQVGIRVNDGSSTQSGSEVGRGDGSDQHTMGFMQLWQGVAASTTLAVEAQTTGFPVDKVYASIVAIRLDALADYNSTFIAASGDLSTGPTTIVTVGFTATGTADYGFISGATGPHAGSQGAPNFIRNDLNGGGDATIAGSETQFGIANIVIGTTDNVHWGVSADQSLTASDVVDADLVANDANTPVEWFNCFLVAFQWALAGGIDEFFDVGNVGYVTRHKGQASQFFDVGLTDYVQFDHDGADFNITGFQTADINITGITAINAGTVDVDFDDITATTYGAILEENLLDKIATEFITGDFTFDDSILAIAGATAANKVSISHDDIDLNIVGANTTDINITGITAINAAAVDASFNDLSIGTIQFDLTDATAASEGLLKWNSDDGTLEFGLPGGNVNIQIGQEHVIRVRNTTGVQIDNGSVVYITGAQGNKPLIALADADSVVTSRVIAVATEDIGHNSNGYVTTAGLVRDVNTNGMAEGSDLWLSTTAGAFQVAEPPAPATAVFVGHVLAEHTNNGVILVAITPDSRVRFDDLDLDLQANLELNIGVALDQPDVSVSSNGTVITFSLEQNGGGDVRFMFSDGVHTHDCTPTATVALTAGTDTSPQINYVYILQSTKALTAATGGWPSAEHTALATIFCQTAASMQTDGAYKMHAWTDHNWDDEIGHLAHLNFWIRSQPATWRSGTLCTPSVGAATFDIAIATGEVLQLHPHAYPAFDTSTGSELMIVNQNGTPFDRIGDMVSQITDASGGSMSGKYYNLIVWGVVSEDSGDCQLMVNLPTASYNTEAAAILDADATTVYDIPTNFIGTGFLIARLVTRHQVGGNTYSISSNIDLRGRVPSTSAGGTVGGGVTSFGDLTDVDPTGFSNNDLMYWASGVLVDTAGLLTWDGSLFDITGDLQVSGDVGFYGTAAVAQQTSVPVTAAGVHAALVNLGLITA